MSVMHLFTINPKVWRVTEENVCSLCGKVEGLTHLPSKSCVVEARVGITQTWR